jgi:S1-C subfamily serine protease
MALLLPAVCSGAGQKEIARAGKAATAFVEAKTPRGIAYGSAFCVHKSGFFITNHHVIANAQEIKIVINSGEKTEKVLIAKVLRSDPEVDLALLQVKGENLPVLSLGSDAGLVELAEVIACGFPFGQLLSTDRQMHPAISINIGKVTSLRKKDNKLQLIQIDITLNPGNSGGPVLDQDGKVVGVVLAGIKGAGVNFAIPVSKVHAFVEAPEISFQPPMLTRARMTTPITFKARVMSLLSAAKSLDVDLVLRRGSKQLKVRMEEKDGVFLTKVAPVLEDESKSPLLECSVVYTDGHVAGAIEDKEFKIGDQAVKLSDVRSISLKRESVVVLFNDKTLQGKITGLGSLTLQLGGKKIGFDLGSATEVKLAAAPGYVISCTIIVSRDGKELGRLSRVMADGSGWNKHFLCDLNEFDVRVGWGRFGKAGKLGYDVNGSGDVKFNGAKAPKAISMAPPSGGYSTVKYRLDKKSSFFKSTIGLHESERASATPLTFEVLGDGKSLWKSKAIKAQKETDECLVDVSTVDVLELRVHCPGSLDSARAIWVNPELLPNATGARE